MAANIVKKEEIDYSIINNAIKYARDQAGCRLLQTWIELRDDEINRLIFENVITLNKHYIIYIF